MLRGAENVLLSPFPYDDGPVPEPTGEGARSLKIIFSHSSQLNTSTSGRPPRPGKDSKKRSFFPQNGQMSKALSGIGPTASL